MLKRWIRRAHLLLGLVSGLGVFILALTGALLAFEQEIRGMAEPWRSAPGTDAPLPPSALIAAAQASVPGKAASAVGYEGPGRSATVEFYLNGEHDRVYWLIAYLNPSDGRVLKVVDRLQGTDFFQFVLDGHTRFWMPRDIGHALVGYATLIFTLMLISGIILWWPRNLAILKHRLSVKWKTGWKRRVYDLHAVPGFYASLIAIFIALTGLAWSFAWFSNGVQWIASGGEPAIEWSEPSSSHPPAVPRELAAALDSTWSRLAVSGSFSSLFVRLPRQDESPITVISNPDAMTIHRTDYLYFDRHTLRELPVPHAWGRYADASAAGRLQRMYYDIHVGAILGIPGKILAFLAALVCATLPVTGFLIWQGKRRAPKKASS